MIRRPRKPRPIEVSTKRMRTVDLYSGAPKGYGVGFDADRKKARLEPIR